ncbi:MAG: BLUF domain-containing protein [Alphaproteobacteria bacterium]|jgi:hypothetical protein
MVHQVIYSSRAADGIGADSLQAILDAARVNNAALGVTGALIYYDGLFLQILEGPKGAVESLAARIADDPRHSDMTIFHTADIDGRVFGDWQMAWLDPAPGDIARWADLETASLADLRADIERHPDRVPGILQAILAALPAD